MNIQTPFFRTQKKSKLVLNLWKVIQISLLFRIISHSQNSIAVFDNRTKTNFAVWFLKKSLTKLKAQIFTEISVKTFF